MCQHNACSTLANAQAPHARGPLPVIVIMNKLLLLLIIMCLLCENSFSQVEIRGVTTIVTDGIQSDSVNLSPNKDLRSE